MKVECMADIIKYALKYITKNSNILDSLAIKNCRLSHFKFPFCC